MSSTCSRCTSACKRPWRRWPRNRERAVGDDQRERPAGRGGGFAFRSTPSTMKRLEPTESGDEMKIRIDCPALDGGGARLDVVAVTGGYELPPSPGGVRDRANMTITFPVGSPAHGALREVSERGELCVSRAMKASGSSRRKACRASRATAWPASLWLLRADRRVRTTARGTPPTTVVPGSSTGSQRGEWAYRAGSGPSEASGSPRRGSGERFSGRTP